MSLLMGPRLLSSLANIRRRGILDGKVFLSVKKNICVYDLWYLAIPLKKVTFETLPWMRGRWNWKIC